MGSGDRGEITGARRRVIADGRTVEFHGGELGEITGGRAVEFHGGELGEIADGRTVEFQSGGCGGISDARRRSWNRRPSSAVAASRVFEVSGPLPDLGWRSLPRLSMGNPVRAVPPFGAFAREGQARSPL
jgi:hypothetical protein